MASVPPVAAVRPTGAALLPRLFAYVQALGLERYLGRRAGRVWAALDAHQVPYWGRGQVDRFQKGWSGSRSRRLRGYRLYLAVDCGAGQVVTFLLLRGRARDARVAALLARRCRAVLGHRLAGVVADCGFTSRSSVGALLASGVPFVLGFARSRPVRAR